jgi:hypothetical protein
MGIDDIMPARLKVLMASLLDLLLSSVMIKLSLQKIMAQFLVDILVYCSELEQWMKIMLIQHLITIGHFGLEMMVGAENRFSY